MSKKVKLNESQERKYLREFVNGIINKDYATANASLTSAVKEKIKARVNATLQENQ
jgi:hypothetical protein